MHIKLKIIVLFIFVFFAKSAFAQSKKLVKSFKLGAVGYTIYESHKLSKYANDTTFFNLYRVGSQKLIAKEIMLVVERSMQDTLTAVYYVLDKNSISFFQVSKEKPLFQRLYIQNNKGLLSLSSHYIAIPPPILPLRKSGKVTDEQTLLEVVDVMPEYAGGINEARKFIANHIQYPDEAIENNVQGTVRAKFVVEIDGSMSNIQIEKKLGYGCDEEVIRVLKKMPKWKPGQLKGKPIRVLFRLPVTFVYSE